jgi:uncharacterized protein YndB with AHSA1/START domain
MIEPGVLHIAARGEREIAYSRIFAAPRQLVFDAHTKPELVRQWLGARGGWIMAVCEIGLRAGGRYRYVWRHEARNIDMGMGGEYLEVQSPARLKCTELFDQAWYAGGCVITTDFAEEDGHTLLSVNLLYDSAAARDGVLASPAFSGVQESYDALAKLLLR